MQAGAEKSKKAGMKQAEDAGREVDKSKSATMRDVCTVCMYVRAALERWAFVIGCRKKAVCWGEECFLRTRSRAALF